MSEEKKYAVVCYMRIVPEEGMEFMTYEEAMIERDHCRYLQPENKYYIESFDPDELQPGMETSSVVS